nr:PREDICTED: uncharacterized protein C9orf78 homolog [Equus przewalskii]
MGGGGGSLGVPGSAHLAAAFGARGKARPPAAWSGGGVTPARRGPAPRSSRRGRELTCRRNRATAACQSSAPPAAPPRVEGPGRPRPASSPSAAQSGEDDATDGGVARREVRAGGGTRRGRLPKAQLGQVSSRCAVDLSPGGSRRRFAFWTTVPAAQQREQGASGSCFLTLSSAGSLSACALNFFRLKLEETREVQNLRKRPNGVSAVALLVGEKVQEETTLVDDPFQMKTGGMVDMKKLKERGKDKISEEEDLHLGTSFSAETNRRDEDADMMKYIETELKKRKGIVEHEEQKVKPKNAEDCLYELPENIRVSSAKKTEEMLSNQMLSGIPEVDLGIDAKIKNIISTEDAKARLLAEQQNKKKDSETSFVPTNMAVNYVQHNRFYHEELNAPIRRNKEEPKARPLRVGDTEKPEPERSPPNRKRPANEKATDDYHYEKFKKMNRRY